MRTIKSIVTSVASVVILPMSAIAVPCVSDYDSYRDRLISEKWTPVAVRNNVRGFTEVSTGTRIATAKWLNPDRTETFIFVLWWQKTKLCVSPQFTVSPE
jgi:hypothetical protein